MLRLLLAFLPLALLILLVAQINHMLAPWHVYLYIDGLLVVFAALRLDFRPGLGAVFLAGLFADAGEPVRFGTDAMLLAIAYVFIFSARRRLPLEEPLVGLTLGLIANLGIFLALSLLLFAHSPVLVGILPRLLVDLLCSQILLALIASWFFALQARVFALAGFELRGRPRSLI